MTKKNESNGYIRDKPLDQPQSSLMVQANLKDLKSAFHTSIDDISKQFVISDSQDLMMIQYSFDEANSIDSDRNSSVSTRLGIENPQNAESNSEVVAAEVDISDCKEIKGLSSLKRKHNAAHGQGSDTDSSTEPDNSDDDDYQPTQRHENTNPIDAKRIRKKSSSQKCLLWVPLAKNSNFLEAQRVSIPVHKTNSTPIRVNICVGDQFFQRKSKAPLTVVAILKKNSEFKVKNESGTVSKTLLQNLLLAKESGNAPSKLDLSQFGFLLSIGKSVDKQSLGNLT